MRSSNIPYRPALSTIQSQERSKRATGCALRMTFPNPLDPMSPSILQPPTLPSSNTSPNYPTITTARLGATSLSLNAAFTFFATTKMGKLVDYPATYSIRPTPTSPPEQFNQKPIGEAHRTLGIHITPGLKPKRQFELLWQKSIHKSLLMRINPFPPDATYTGCQQDLQPAILYPLIAQRLPNRAINKLQSPIIIQLLYRLNLSSTMSCCLLHLPPRFGGAGNRIRLSLPAPDKSNFSSQHSMPRPSIGIPCGHPSSPRSWNMAMAIVCLQQWMFTWRG